MDQAAALSQSGNDVGLVAPVLASIAHFPITSPLAALSEIFGGPEQFTERGVKTLRRVHLAAPKLRKLNRKRWVDMGLELVDQYIIEIGRPDIIHAHSALYAGVLANLVKARYKIPYVLTEHSSAVIEGRVHEWQHSDLNAAISESSHRIAVSGALSEALRGMNFIQKKDWTVIPNVLSEEFFFDPRYDSSSVDSPYFTFFAAGGLIHLKGFDVLVDAVAACPQELRIRIFIAGEGPERRSLEGRIRELGLHSKIHLLGQLSRSDLRNRMKECNAFILSSRAETFGVVVIEAMAMGKPVIATRCGGPEEIVLENTGVLVPKENPLSLSDAMVRLATGQLQFNALNIRDSCIDRFGAPAVVSDLERIYQEVVVEHT